MRRPTLIAVACAVAAGCGTPPADAPDLLSVEPPGRFAEAEFPDAGITLRAPTRWESGPRPAPGVFTLQSGTAQVTAWAYPRAERLPRNRAALRVALRRLRRQITRRDRRFRITEARATRVAGSPALEVVGRQTISGRTLATRSVHVFKRRVEYVFEALAAPEDFRLVSGEVLDPLLGSLELSGRLSRDRRRQAES